MPIGAIPKCLFHQFEFNTMTVQIHPGDLSRADGQIAWMNLDGHSVELKLVKQTFWYRADGHAFTRNEYRSGKTLILVSYPQYTDHISDYPAKIILRRGGATRTILATGQPLCD